MQPCGWKISPHLPNSDSTSSDKAELRVRVSVPIVLASNTNQSTKVLCPLRILPSVSNSFSLSSLRTADLLDCSRCKFGVMRGKARSGYPLNMTSREVLLGLTGRDFTIIAASKAAMRGATILKSSDDKTRQLNRHTLLAFSGEAGDTVQFAEFIQANIALYTMRNETDLGPSAVASFVRGELARSLRSRKPYNVNLLLGGMDPITKQPSLYWLDYLASSAKVPYAAHGYAQ